MKRICYLLALCAGLLLTVTALAADLPTDDMDYVDYYAHHTDREHDGLFRPWTSDDSLPTRAGNYFLETDVVITSIQQLEGGTVVLCLNGHDLTLGASYCAEETASLLITDCSTAPGTLTNRTPSGGGHLVMRDLYLFNINLDLHVSDDSGTPFYVDADQSLNIQNCDIDITVQTADGSALGSALLIRSGSSSEEDPSASVSLTGSTIDVSLDVSQIPELLENSGHSVKIIDNLENSHFTMEDCTLSFSCADSRCHARITNSGTMELDGSELANISFLNSRSTNAGGVLTIQDSTLSLGAEHGIFNQLGTLRLDEVAFSGDTISSEGGETTLTDCEITGDVLNGLELDGHNENGLVTIRSSTVNGRVRTGSKTTTTVKNTSITADSAYGAVENSGSATLEACSISASGLIDVSRGERYYSHSAAIVNQGTLTIQGSSVRASSASGKPIACVLLADPAAVVTLGGASRFSGGLAHIFLMDASPDSDVIPLQCSDTFEAPAAAYTIAGFGETMEPLAAFTGKILVSHVADTASSAFQLVKLPTQSSTAALDYHADDRTLRIGTSRETGNSGGHHSSGPVQPAIDPQPHPDTSDMPGYSFSDVRKDAYYHDAVQWAIANRITTGTSETTFSPDDSCLRAQIITFLWRLAGCPLAEDTGRSFADAEEGSYYYDAVQWAVQNGITLGISSDLFGSGLACTRGQVVAMLYRYAGSPAAAGNSCFADVPADAYYRQAVQWAAENGITGGTTETTFSPDAVCTRGQIVTFLYRAFADR